MEMIQNRSFTLITGNGKLIKLRRLRNGVPQGSVLAPLLFNIYIHDLPATISKRYAYADDLAIMHSSRDWRSLEETLSQDMATLSGYLHNWRLKLSEKKTVSAVFHLNNKEARRELNVHLNGKLLPFCPSPTYLGVTLDRALTYRCHIVSLRKKLASRVALLRRLAGSGWGADATVLRTSTLALVHSTAEYCAPAWCRSVHTRLADSTINDALRIVTGCLRPTPTAYLPILAGIQPAELRRKGATLRLARRALEPNHLLHSKVMSQPPGTPRLKSRRPFVPAAQELLKILDSLEISAARWTDHTWNLEWQSTSSRLHGFIPDAGPRPPGISLPRAAWVRLNRLRTGVGRFRSSMHKWGLAPSAACECGAEEQTADHVILSCPRHRLPNGTHGLKVLDDDTTTWLTNTCLSI